MERAPLSCVLVRMTDAYGRFECVREQAGTWAVIDHETGKPASLAGKLLVGRDRMKAESACRILRAIHKTGLENKNGNPGGAELRGG